MATKSGRKATKETAPAPTPTRNGVQSAGDDLGEPPQGLWAKMLWVTAHCGHLSKTGHNKEQDYDYVEEAVVMAHVRPLLVQAGLALCYTEKSCAQVSRINRDGHERNDITKVEVEHTLRDVASGEAHTWTTFGYGFDSLEKGVFKALTGAHKYAIMKTFQIPTGDDPERDAPPKEEPRRQERRPNRQGPPPEQQEYDKPKAAPQPVRLETLTKAKELAENVLLPPSERKRAHAFLETEEAKLEKPVLSCIAALERMIGAAEREIDESLAGVS